jgi:hypothetical protein
MLEKINEYLGVEIKRSTYIYMVIILFGLFFIVVSSSFSNHKSNIPKSLVDKEHISELFNDINDNYSLDIDIEINEIVKNVLYSRDKSIELYEGNLFTSDGYLIYNDKVFELNNNELTKIDKDKNSFKDTYSDLKFIRNLISYCEYDYINTVKATCNMKLSDYLNEFNKYNDTNINTDYDDMISFDIVYYSDVLGKILFDYSKINKVITGEDDTVKYGVRIINVDKNDYSELYELEKEILDN